MLVSSFPAPVADLPALWSLLLEFSIAPADTLVLHPALYHQCFAQHRQCYPFERCTVLFVGATFIKAAQNEEVARDEFGYIANDASPERQAAEAAFLACPDDGRWFKRCVACEGYFEAEGHVIGPLEAPRLCRWLAIRGEHQQVEEVVCAFCTRHEWARGLFRATHQKMFSPLSSNRACESQQGTC